MIANEQEVNRLFGDVSKKIVGKERQTNLKFDPKIYTKSKEGVVVARLFSDEDGKSYADSEGSISMKRYYVLSDGLGMAKISTMEKPFKKEVVIMGITTYGQIQLNEDAIKRSATAAINSLMSINYDEINVSVYRDCTYEVMKETRWL